MSFFDKFPLRDYDIETNNRIRQVVNIFRHVAANSALVEDITTYTVFEVLEGERPDTVSQRLYGTPDYYWTFFIADEALKGGLHDWPKDSQTLERELQLEFDDAGALVLVPEIRDRLRLFSDGGFNQSRVVDNVGGQTLAGVDFNYPQLRIKRNNKYARVKNWNNNLLQLQLHTFADSPKGPNSASAKTTFFASDGGSATISFDTGDNASPGLDSPRMDFIKSLAQGLTNSFIDIDSTYLADNGVATDGSNMFYLHEEAINRHSSPNGLYGNFRNTIINVFNKNASGIQSLYDFSPRRTYSDFRSAPAYYYANSDTTNIISAYEAFNQPSPNSPDVGNQFTSASSDTFVTNSTNEQDKNDERRFIKVIRPELIQQFVETYEQLINE